jgi:hypothetical protein
MRPVVENRSQPGPEPAAVETRLRAEQNDRFALARWAVVPPVLLAQPRHEQVSGNVAEYRGRTRHRTPDECPVCDVGRYVEQPPPVPARVRYRRLSGTELPPGRFGAGGFARSQRPIG